MLDYIRLTVKYPASMPDCPNTMADYAYRIARDIHTTSPVVDGHGSYGYTHGFTILGVARVMWGDYRMGVCIELSGTALRTWESHNDGADALSLLAYLLVFRPSARVTRIDCAIDTDQLHIHTFRDAVREGKLVTRSQTIRYLESFSDSGDTLYVGARQSDRLLRIYNKAVEQGVTDTVWTRVELESKGELAHLTAIALVDARCTESDLIASFVDFRELDNKRSNLRTRCAWWDALMSGAQSLTLRTKTALHDLVQRKMKWIEKSVAPTLALLSMVLGSTDWMKFEVQAALDRIDPKHYALIS